MERKCGVCRLNKVLMVTLDENYEETDYILSMFNFIAESNVSWQEKNIIDLNQFEKVEFFFISLRISLYVLLFSQNVSLPNYICYPCLDNLRSAYRFQQKLHRITHPKQPTNFQKMMGKVVDQGNNNDCGCSTSSDSGTGSGSDTQRPFKCEICHREFKIKEHIDTHLKRHRTKPKQFRCTTCKLIFLTVKHFEVHSSSCSS